MKSRSPLHTKIPIAISLVTAICLSIYLFKKSQNTQALAKEKSAPQASSIRSSSSTKNLEPYELTDPNTDWDALAREVPSEVERVTNAAGHTIIASADTSDAEKTDALLKSFARGKAHLEHMRRENAFVTRRQIIELSKPFAEIGNSVLNGEELQKLEIPDFDGKTFPMDYDPTLMGPESEGAGTLIGSINGAEASDVILGYYNGSTSAYVNLPTEGRVLEYMTVGGNQIVIKEIDLEARNRAEPCRHCSPNAEGHSPHPAGWAHELSQKNKHHTP